MLMMPTVDMWQALRQAIAEAQRILLCTHLHPDGDAVGSLLAMGAYLRTLGKDFAMVCHDAPVENLRFLPGTDQILLPWQVDSSPFDLALCLDASDALRLGDVAGLFAAAKQTALIDHHRTNTLFAQINIVDPLAPSTGTLVLRFLQQTGIALTSEMALLLYAAISTDTGNFCYSAVTQETFCQIADLLGVGFPLAKTARLLHLMYTRSQLCLLGRALSCLQYAEQGLLTGMSLSAEDLLACAATNADTDKIVNYGLNIPGVVMSYLAVQTDQGIKFSLRTVEPYDVSAIALEFGGGGHQLAAGCTLYEPLDSATRRMRSALIALLRS